ncbi:unnamed protein product [Polarella glacialis]|uniref:Uncharacterized protein n=1 Tax=Polarella glacialis TaxID=89957 RepID=A0A813KM65_POLGL|nr:unnamed protein product [Polarella glacialis]
MDSLPESFSSPSWRNPPQKNTPSPSDQLTAEHTSTGKQQLQQPRRKASFFKNVAVRLMRQILSKDSSRKVSSVEEAECCQNVEAGVDVKEAEEEEEEDLSECFAHGELTPEQSSLLKDWQLALFQYIVTYCQHTQQSCRHRDKLQASMG